MGNLVRHTSKLRPIELDRELVPERAKRVPMLHLTVGHFPDARGRAIAVPCAIAWGPVCGCQLGHEVVERDDSMVYCQSIQFKQVRIGNILLHRKKSHTSMHLILQLGMCSFVGLVLIDPLQLKLNVVYRILNNLGK